MFRGRYETTVDAKGRTSLPVRFREVLASRDRSLAGPTAAARGLVLWQVDYR